MREFIGHEVKLVVQDMGAISGTVVNDTQVFLFVKGSNGKIARIVKSKICAFTPVDFEPFVYVPFFVLQCLNKHTGCKGVQYIKRGAAGVGFTQTDFEYFMVDCPCRVDTCSCGSKGELRTVDGEFLGNMFADVMFGEYPKKKEDGDGRKGSGRKAGKGKKDDSAVHDREESA